MADLFTVEPAPIWLLLTGYYLCFSLATFLIYAWDKSAATRGRWRVREKTLHLWSLLGGWPGALIAQRSLRHKSRKQPFRKIFWLTVMLNSAGLLWIFTPHGTDVIAMGLNLLVSS